LKTCLVGGSRADQSEELPELAISKPTAASVSAENAVGLKLPVALASHLIHLVLFDSFETLQVFKN
jgi:hypothetical protein